MNDLRKTKRPEDWPKSGWYWFLHHDQVMEYTPNIDERRDYVCANKPLDELPMRLKAMRPVQGEVPEGVTKAWDAYYKAEAALNKARDACDKAWGVYVKARAARDKAWSAVDKAWDTYATAWAAVDTARDTYVKAWAALNKALRDNYDEIERLRLVECPDVPWDGKSLVYEERS